MADANDNPTDGPDGPNNTPDGDVAKLQKQLETLQAELEAEKARKAKAVEDAKAEREKRKKEAEAAGEYEKAKAEREKQIAELESQVAELKGLEAYREKWTAHEATRRSELLEKLPTEMRERFKDRPLDVLEDAVALIPDAHGVDVDGARRGGGPGGQSKNWYDMNDTERAAWSNGVPPEKVKEKITADWKLKRKQ